MLHADQLQHQYQLVSVLRLRGSWEAAITTVGSVPNPTRAILIGAGQAAVPDHIGRQDRRKFPRFGRGTLRMCLRHRKPNQAPAPDFEVRLAHHVLDDTRIDALDTGYRDQRALRRLPRLPPFLPMAARRATSFIMKKLLDRHTVRAECLIAPSGGSTAASSCRHSPLASQAIQIRSKLRIVTAVRRGTDFLYDGGLSV